MRCGVLRADLVVVSKQKREMVLLQGESVLRTYQVALGREPVGAKREEGDGRTPEGRYTIDWRNAKSKYHLSLHISYPDAADVARARGAGGDAGGGVMIHGSSGGGGWWGGGPRCWVGSWGEEARGFVCLRWVNGFLWYFAWLGHWFGFGGFAEFLGFSAEFDFVVNEGFLGFEREFACRKERRPVSRWIAHMRERWGDGAA